MDDYNYHLKQKIIIITLTDNILSYLKILHISHESLPDWRIEKAAISALNNGHQVAFAGICPKKSNNKTFSEIYNLGWTAKARFGIPFYWRSVKPLLVFNDFCNRLEQKIYNIMDTCTQKYLGVSYN